MSVGVLGTGAAGAAAPQVVTVQGIAGGVALPVATPAGSAAQVEGRAADGDANVGNPVYLAGRDLGGAIRALLLQDVSADGVAISSPALNVNARGLLFNGATNDRQRNNTESVLLASAARTIQTDTATQTNHNARGAIFGLNITVSSGTGGLVLNVQAMDPASGNFYTIAAAGAALTTNGQRAYGLYPGIGPVVLTQSFNSVLPRTYRIRIAVGDASSYTYSLGQQLII